MGAKHSQFEEENMTAMLACTSLNRTEIYHAFRQFRAIHEQYVPGLDEERSQLFTLEGMNNPEVSLPIEYIINNMPILKANPLGARICQVFASEKEGRMNFLEFLDMVSAFNPKTSLPVRTVYAFKVFDTDGDGVVSRNDLETVLDLFTDFKKGAKDKRWEETKNVIINGVFKEVNKSVDTDGLSREDFSFAISRSPDFVSTFSFRV